MANFINVKAEIYQVLEGKVTHIKTADIFLNVDLIKHFRAVGENLNIYVEGYLYKLKNTSIEQFQKMLHDQSFNKAMDEYLK